MTALLEVDGVSMRFGGLIANENVSFAVKPGQIFAVIGPNGAGKTTLFNAITGIYQPTEGRVLFQGREIREALDLGTMARAAITGVAAALSLVVCLNINEIWTATIDGHFTFGKPFPWGEALASFWSSLTSLGHAWGTVPALIGFVVGCAASLVLWSNARRTPDLIARHGIARTFQNIRLFPELDLISNVLVGMDSRLRSRYVDALLRTPRFRRERETACREALDLLHFVDLREKADEQARNLPYGHQRRLEIARALASKPSLLLLDEPAAGMNPAETIELMQLIRKVRDRGITVVLIEHHMRVVMGISDRIVVLQYGKKIAEGTPTEIRNDERCIEAYLGKEELG